MSSKNVLAVFAHPDDDELSCFGFLLRMIRSGYRVNVLELSKGEQSVYAKGNNRFFESKKSSENVGINLISADFPDGSIRYEIQTIKTIEEYFDCYDPFLVLTHYPQNFGKGHQDHAVISSCVTNVARRRRIPFVIYTEPVPQNEDFVPNLFIDISDVFEQKIKAISSHLTEIKKPYMQRNAIKVRAKWWAYQADPLNLIEGRYFEAFQINKAVLHMMPRMFHNGDKRNGI